MLRAAADRGRIVIAGATAPWPEDGGDPEGQIGPTTPVGLNELLRQEVSVVGSYQTGFSDSHPYWPWTRSRNRSIVLDLIGRGDLDVRPLVSHVVEAAEAPEIYDMLLSGPAGWLSVALTWND
jgi:threonine dehydrogenase-like Zn-dependent dehydrogenase